MRHVTPWLTVSTIDFTKSAGSDLAQGRFRTLPSPNNSPSAVRMWFLDAKHGSSVEFDYLATESTVLGRFSDSLVMRFGSKTKRIHEITFEKELPGDVASLIRLTSSALEKFRKVQGGSGHAIDLKLHCETVRKAVASCANELFFLMKNQ